MRLHVQHLFDATRIGRAHEGGGCQLPHPLAGLLGQNVAVMAPMPGEFARPGHAEPLSRTPIRLALIHNSLLIRSYGAAAEALAL